MTPNPNSTYLAFYYMYLPLVFNLVFANYATDAKLFQIHGPFDETILKIAKLPHFATHKSLENGHKNASDCSYNDTDFYFSRGGGRPPDPLQKAEYKHLIGPSNALGFNIVNVNASCS